MVLLGESDGKWNQMPGLGPLCPHFGAFLVSFYHLAGDILQPALPRGLGLTIAVLDLLPQILHPFLKALVFAEEGQSLGEQVAQDILDY